MLSRLLSREACWICVERMEMKWSGGAIGSSVGGAVTEVGWVAGAGVGWVFGVDPKFEKSPG